MTPGERPVACEREDGLAVLRLSGRHGNAINHDLLEGLATGLASIREGEGIRGVLVCSGGKLFCPGLDLRELIDLDRPAMDRFMERFSRIMLDIYALPLPVAVALEGHAIAGGCVLAMTADWRVLNRMALIGLNEVKVGVPLPWGVAQVLREAVAGSRLEEVCLLGRNYSGEEALATGLAHELTPPGEAEPVARARLEELGAKDTRSLGLTKTYLRRTAIERIRAGEEACRGEWLDSWFSPDTRARVREIVDGLGKR